MKSQVDNKVDQGALIIARLLMGEPVEGVADLPDPYRILAAQLVDRSNNKDAVEIWEQLIADRPDADQLRAAVLVARTQLAAPSKTEESAAWSPLPIVEVPELPEQARLPDKWLKDLDSESGGWLTEYIDFASKASPMSPREFHEILGLMDISAAIARRVVLKVSTEEIYPNLYALIVARSTIYRKSTAFRIAGQTLEKSGLGRMMLPTRMTPQSLLMELSRRAPPDYEAWESEDKEDWLAERAFAGQRVWLMEESASLFEAFETKRAAELLPMVLDFWDNPAKRTYSTIGRGRQTVRRAYLSLCGPTTPAALRPHLNNPTYWGNGLWPRFIFVTPIKPPDRYDFYPAVLDVPKSLVDPLHKLAYKALPMPVEEVPGAVKPAEPLSVELASGVWDRWEAYGKALEFDLLLAGSVPERLHPSYGRFKMHAMKMAMLLAAIDWCSHSGRKRAAIVVRRRHWVRAQIMAERWRASLHSVLEAVHQDDREDIHDRIMRYLSPDEGRTLRELAQLLNKTSSMDYEGLKHDLNRMEEMGLAIGRERKGRRGPSAQEWLRAQNP